MASARLRGYFELTRLHKPFMGNTLLFWPFAWGLTITARQLAMPIENYWRLLGVLAVGSMLLHSADCVLNDICDIEFDRLVERTRNRPLAARRVSLLGAWVLCLALFLPVVYLLSLGNPLTVWLGIPSHIILHGLYPLMKRWTWWPQAWLGLGFNWGIPFSWVIVTGELPPRPFWIFYVGGICWTIVYDTIYACQDREDDKKIGVKSTALLFGSYVRPILAAHAAVFVMSLVAAGQLLHLGAGFAFLSCGGALAQLSWQLATWDESGKKDHRAKFESNGLLAVVIYLGLLYDYATSLGFGPREMRGLVLNQWAQM